MATTKITKDTVVADPPIARFLFSDTRMALVWLLVRVYVGWAWLEAGWHKVQTTGPGNYINDGSGILAFWNSIVKTPPTVAKAPITYDWYRGFIQWLIDIQAQGVMGKVVAFGETAVGLGLIFGAFVGVAAVSGAFMNLNFMLAGSASTNPVLLLLGFLLVLAWKTAGYIGLDRFLLPLVGTPWKVSQAERQTVVPVPTSA